MSYREQDLSLDKMWRNMLSQSFNPSQWFENDGEVHDHKLPDLDDVLFGGTMWVYRIENTGVFVVGYYSPNKEWHPESYHANQLDAAARVRWLNGGDMSQECK